MTVQAFRLGQRDFYCLTDTSRHGDRCPINPHSVGELCVSESQFTHLQFLIFPSRTTVVDGGQQDVGAASLVGLVWPDRYAYRHGQSNVGSALPPITQAASEGCRELPGFECSSALGPRRFTDHQSSINSALCCFVFYSWDIWEREALPLITNAHK